MGAKFTATRSKLRQILSLYAVDLQTSTKIKDGMINSSYFVNDRVGKEYVLRVYQQGNRTDQEITHELAVTELFRSKKIPVPPLVKTPQSQGLVHFQDGGQTWRVVLMHKAAGRHLLISDRAVLPEFAALHAKMHLAAHGQPDQRSTSRKTLKFLRSWLDEEAQTAKPLLQEVGLWSSFAVILQEVQSYFSDHQTSLAKLPAGDCHLDYDSNNVLVEDKKITAILDFDDIAWAPFILDCGNSLWWWLYFSDAKDYQTILQTYLESYSQSRTVSDNERRYLLFFIRLRNATLAPLLFVNSLNRVNKRAFRRAITFDRLIQSAINSS